MKSPLNRIITSLVVFFFGFTLLVSAQGGATQQATGAFSSLKTIIESFSADVLTALGTLFMGMAVVIFFFGIVQYILGAREGKEDKIKAGNQFMMWSLLALFVMFSVYGIVKWGQDIFFKGQDITTITIPQVKFNTTNGGTGGTTADPGRYSVCETTSPPGSCTTPCKTASGAQGTCNSLGQCCR